MSMADKLINECEKKLHTRQGGIDLDNRPHYPLMVLFNKGFSQVATEHIYSRTERIWSTSARHELFYKYEFDGDSNVLFKSCLETDTENESCRDLTAEDIGAEINKVTGKENIHEDLTKWIVINVIDTSCYENADGFKNDYNLFNAVREMLPNSRVILLVLLHDEKTGGDDTASEIRSFLKDNQ